jgi:hypothetical protein
MGGDRPAAPGPDREFWDKRDRKMITEGVRDRAAVRRYTADKLRALYTAPSPLAPEAACAAPEAAAAALTALGIPEQEAFDLPEAEYEAGYARRRAELAARAQEPAARAQEPAARAPRAHGSRAPRPRAPRQTAA